MHQLRSVSLGSKSGQRVVSWCSTASYTPRVTYDRQSLQSVEKARHAQNTIHHQQEKEKKKNRRGIKAYLEDAICLNGINAQTRILATPNNFLPIPNRARARPQRGPAAGSVRDAGVSVQVVGLARPGRRSAGVHRSRRTAGPRYGAAAAHRGVPALSGSRVIRN